MHVHVRVARLAVGSLTAAALVAVMAGPAAAAKADKTSTTTATTTKAGKTTTAAPAAAGDNCSENEIFTAGKGGATTQFPAPGVTVKPGDTVGAYYNDESEINLVAPLVPAASIDGKAVTATVQKNATATGFTKLQKFVTKVSFVIPQDAAPGDHTAMLRAWDSDQNKPGGDCGTATWKFTVAGTPTTTTPPTTTPPTTTAPTTTPPTTETPSTVKPVPQVLAATATAPAPAATPVKKATLPFTGSDTGPLGLLAVGIAIMGGGFVLAGRRETRQS